MLLATALVVASLAVWQRPMAPVETRWAKDVSPDNPHPEYPRPQMERSKWLSLNGKWDLAIVPRANPKPQSWSKSIVVPFPIESALSGVMEPVSPEQAAWYRRSISVPSEWKGRTLLHFGAVDWETTVWLNGHELGTHRGGYDPFSFDITPHLQAGKQELVVRVWDPTDTGTQPRGKQVGKPSGIWYTPTTGIWQSVWIEPVPERSIGRVRIDASNLRGIVKVRAEGKGLDGLRLEATVGEARADAAATSTVSVQVPNPKLWSPESPKLYPVVVRLMDGQREVDKVTTSIGIRSVSVVKDGAGITRLALNGKPYFMVGPLDQGFWPDGLYAAPTDEALRYDVEMTKRLGFNMIRKHVKIEPARWYKHCDELGILVWQDMPSGDKYIGGADPDVDRTQESASQFEAELLGLMRLLESQTSVVAWVPFNEGWGQYDTARIAMMIRRLDPTRLVNSVSGWTDRGVGDMHDIHVYPGPGSPDPEPKRAAVLGEFGGLGLLVKGHTWKGDGWGYRSMASRSELDDTLVALIERTNHLRAYPGLSAAVYTQTTDVEVEINGLMTYDRAILKVDEKRLKRAVQALAGPVPTVDVLVPTSQTERQSWAYTTSKPVDGWEAASFDDSAWKKGPGGFGTAGTPGAVIGTVWSTGDIWIRRTFRLDREESGLHLIVHHDEDAEFYIDGKLIASLRGYTSGYEFAPIPQKLAAGTHTFAVHCHQTTGGQFIDVGIAKLGRRQ